MAMDRYSHVESRKKEGAHYTPALISDFISESAVKHADIGEAMCIVDPAVGDGELLVSLIKALKKRGVKNIEAHGFDTNLKSVEITNERVRNQFPEVKLEIHNKDFLKHCLERTKFSNIDAGEDEDSIPDFDLVIANPPYVRTQVLGSEQSKEIGSAFGLKGRLDIYQAFLVAMKAVMKPGGVAGVIVSNRFMTTKGAGVFRGMLHEEYSIKGIWDFGDTKVFEASVLPAVLVMKNEVVSQGGNIPFSSVYLHKNHMASCSIPFVNNQVEAINFSGVVRNTKAFYIVKHGHLTYDETPSDVWRLQDQESESWLERVKAKTWCTFKDVGKIRVGVKTTADNVFIKDNWEEEVGYVPELALPLVTHHVASRFKCKSSEKKSILYTHANVDGRRSVYNIDDYPLSKKYLESHKEQLSSRKYVIKAKRNWYEIWVPQQPKFWPMPKIIFRDITEQPTFWMDLDGSIVNGDCYWMVCDNKNLPDDILWLVLGVANSSFVTDFYDIKFQNKLYSNKRRFISQYVEKFPVPDPGLQISKEVIELAKMRYSETDGNKQVDIERKIDHLVWSIFDVSHIGGMATG